MRLNVDLRLYPGAIGEWGRTNSPSTILFVIRNDFALIWPFIHNTPIKCTHTYIYTY